MGLYGETKCSGCGKVFVGACDLQSHGNERLRSDAFRSCSVFSNVT